MQGRSATDGHDQLRKKLCLAERRIVRAGHKGIAFVFDLAITNMTIIWRELAERAGVKRADLDGKYNKVCLPPPAPHTCLQPCTHARATRR